MMVALLKRLRSENSPQVADAGAGTAGIASSSSSRPSPMPCKPAAAASKAPSPKPASRPAQQPLPRTVSHAQVLGTTRAPKGTFSVRESVGRVLHIAPADIHRMLLSVSVLCSLFFVSCASSFSCSLLCALYRLTENAFYRMLQKYVLGDEQLESNGFPRVDPSSRNKAIVPVSELIKSKGNSKPLKSVPLRLRLTHVVMCLFCILIFDL